MDSSTEREVIAFIDFIPNHIKLGLRSAEEKLKSDFNRTISDKINRWGQLSSESIHIKFFGPLFLQARSLYIDGFFEAAIALCGMTVEALCITIAEDRVASVNLKKELVNPSNSNIRRKIEELKKYLRVLKSASFLHQILDIRKTYLHLHKRKIDPESALLCINLLHLVVLAEYGLVPNQDKFRFSTISDVVERAERMGIL